MAVLALVCVGCAPREGPPPPFRTHPLGPGHEVDLPGVRLVWLDEAGQPRAALRTGSGGVRLFDDRSVRVGRLHRAGEGWALRGRDGTLHCTGRASRTRWVLDCEERGRWSVQSGAEGFTIRRDGTVLGTVATSGEEGRVAVWRATEHEAGRGAPLPPVTVTALWPSCGTEMEVRDSTGRMGGAVRPARWAPSAVAALSGVANVLHAETVSGTGASAAADTWLVSAALAWWIDQSEGRPPRAACGVATDR